MNTQGILNFINFHRTSYEKMNVILFFTIYVENLIHNTYEDIIS
jgi:hypothetical protein